MALAPRIPSPPASAYGGRPYEREEELAYRPRPGRPIDPRDERDIREEAEYYNRRAAERGYVGEGYNGATRDWAIVDVPPGTSRVHMDGVGGGSQEVTWQRYNGVRRSKFIADGDEFGAEYGGAGAMVPAAPGGTGRRYEGMKDKTEGLWTEITKDLVVKEAIKEAGYDFEETEDFFYVIAYLKYVSTPFVFCVTSLTIMPRTTWSDWYISVRTLRTAGVIVSGKSSGSRRPCHLRSQDHRGVKRSYARGKSSMTGGLPEGIVDEARAMNRQQRLVAGGRRIDEGEDSRTDLIRWYSCAAWRWKVQAQHFVRLITWTRLQRLIKTDASDENIE